MRSLIVTMVVAIASQPAYAGPEIFTIPSWRECGQAIYCKIKCVGESDCNSKTFDIDNTHSGFLSLIKGHVDLYCEGKDACNSVDFKCTDPSKCELECSDDSGTPSCNSVTVDEGIAVDCASPDACNSVESEEISFGGGVDTFDFPPGCTSDNYQQRWRFFSRECVVKCIGEGACNSKQISIKNGPGAKKVYTTLFCKGKDACNSVDFYCDDPELCQVKCIDGDPACNSVTISDGEPGAKIPVYCESNSACNSVEGGELVDL